MGVDTEEQLAQLRRRLAERLADLRKAAGRTQHELARHTFVDRSYVSHAERGTNVPAGPFWAAADDYLMAGGRLVAAYDELARIQHTIRQAELDALRAALGVEQPSAVDGAGRPRLGQVRVDPHGATASLRDTVEADGMDRRAFVLLSGSALTAFAHDWLFDPPRLADSLAGRRIGHSIVDGLDQIAEIRRQNDMVGGAELLGAAREDLRLVLGMLDNASYSDDVGTRLYAWQRSSPESRETSPRTPAGNRSPNATSSPAARRPRVRRPCGRRGYPRSAERPGP